MKISQSIRSVVSDEGAVLKDMKTGGTFSLNPVGARVWTMLQEDIPAEEIVDRISLDYQTPREIVESDLREFIKNLENHFLVLRSNVAVT